MSSDLVQLSQQRVHHSDSIRRLRASEGRASSRGETLHLVNQHTHQGSAILYQLTETLEHLLHQLATLERGPGGGRGEFNVRRGGEFDVRREEEGGRQE